MSDVPNVCTGRDRANHRARLGGLNYPDGLWVPERQAVGALDFEKAAEAEESGHCDWMAEQRARGGATTFAEAQARQTDPTTYICCHWRSVEHCPSCGGGLCHCVDPSVFAGQNRGQTP